MTLTKLLQKVSFVTRTAYLCDNHIILQCRKCLILLYTKKIMSFTSCKSMYKCFFTYNLFLSRFINRQNFCSFLTNVSQIIVHIVLCNGEKLPTEHYY